MSIFDKLAKSMTSGTSSSHSSSSRISSTSTIQRKQVTWQCRYCGSRTGTWDDGIPKAGICRARDKVNNMPRPHDWRKV